MRSILDWAISFLSEPSQGTIRAIYFEGKTVKQHSEGEYVTVYAIYKRSTCSKVNDVLSTTYDFPGVVEAVATFVEMRKTPEFDLRDASEMHEKRDYCFEVKSAAYRFRLLELSHGPLYLATMCVDDGVCKDLVKSSDRFVLMKDGKSRLLTIKDDDLDCIFLSPLKSRKLNYICNRLMAEPEE